MNQPEPDFDDVPPAAGPMLESMRAYGYTLETAIADLIDNSISAGAANVWLNFQWDGIESFISILDDGKGMSETELIQGLQPGYRSPLENRPENDLGRFGLGLKTASLSQCKRLTVASAPAGREISVRRWDLDHISLVNKWHLLKTPFSGSENRLIPLTKIPHGTLVLWECMDRVVGDSVFAGPRGHDRFLKLVNAVEQHIGMVFHRFIEMPHPKLRIYINGITKAETVRAWDPFLENHTATIPTPMEPIPCGTGTVNVTGFTLPHKDKLTPEEYKQAAGPGDWVAQQGFYIYRNERMLVGGSWLGMWSKEDHYKLARIRIDIPNSMDMDWQIDIKKSRARPPALVMARLKHLGATVRKTTREIYSSRGSYGARGPQDPIIRLWKPLVRNGRQAYKVDRTHALIKSLLEKADSAELVLRMLEETLPVQQIWLDTAENPETSAAPFEQASVPELLPVLRRTYEALMICDGFTSDEAKGRLKRMDAFLNHSVLIDSIDKEGGNGN